MDVLVLNVAELLTKPGSERFLTIETSIRELGIDEPRLPEGPVVLAARLEALSDGIVVTGSIRARWVGECRRCLSALGGELSIPVQEFYQVRLTDPDAFPLEREQLDQALDLQAKLIEAGERTPELFYNTGLLLQKGAHDIDVIHWLAGGFTRSAAAVGSLSVYGDVDSRRDNSDRRLRDGFRCHR